MHSTFVNLGFSKQGNNKTLSPFGSNGKSPIPFGSIFNYSQAKGKPVNNYNNNKTMRNFDNFAKNVL